MKKITLFVNFFFVKFFCCLLISELSIIKKKIEYLKFFFKEISITKFVFYIFDGKTKPFKSVQFLNFLNENKKYWNNNKKSNNPKNKKKILIENYINHSYHSINNILIGKYLQLIKNYEAIGLLRENDFRGKFLLNSFGINNIYYYKYGGILNRIFYTLKALILIKKIGKFENFLSFKIKKIDIGLLTYDTFLRYTRKPTCKNFEIRLINFFAQALYSINYYEKILKDKNIEGLVQSEKQFIPLSMLFQTFLLSKKRRIYSRIGTDKLCVRIFSLFNQRHENKASFSKSLLNNIFKNKKELVIDKIDQYFKFQFKNKLYGKTWAPLVQNNKKVILKWKKNWEKNKLNNKTLKKIKLKESTKYQLCNKLNWDTKKKIVTIFLPHMIDGNYNQGIKNLYIDNYSWAINTINLISKITHVNWIIREHPEEKRYSTISKFSSILSNIEENNSHIRKCPKNLDAFSLTKITNIALTCHGTAGLEYQSFGIPTVVAEKSLYNHYGFKKSPKNKREYIKILNNIEKIKRPNLDNTIKAKTFLLTNYDISKTECSFIPENLPRFESRMSYEDNNEFWRLLQKNIINYEYLKDPFFSMFKKQILLNNRHTINFDKHPIKNKKFNDL
tara:strand:+ start:2779 stop:4629 length:1851 start_codon:yes stop_codon:yes gene_type:complete